jgi:hypothetical protein
MTKRQRKYFQNNSCKQNSIYTLLVILFIRIPLHTVKQNFVAFFVFGETAASFTTKICSSVTGMKWEAILVLPGSE